MCNSLCASKFIRDIFFCAKLSVGKGLRAKRRLRLKKMCGKVCLCQSVSVQKFLCVKVSV